MTIYGMNFGENFVERYRSSRKLPKRIDYESGHWIEFSRNILLDCMFIRKRMKGCVLDRLGRTLKVREYITIPGVGCVKVVDATLIERDGEFITDNV